MSVDPLDGLLHANLPPADASGEEERVERIAREARDCFRAMAEVRKAVSLFGSARAEPVERWGPLAWRTSETLTRAGFAVITGGGPGLMSEANEAAAAAGGASIGLTIRLPAQEEPNAHLTLQVPFRYFFLRKLAFVKYSCAFVCLPGGFGTLDELFEALNLKCTQRLAPFPVLLVGEAYWSGLVEWLRERAVTEGTLSKDDLDMFEITDDPEVVASRVVECHRELCRTLAIAL